jgi:hypothetical protein
MYNVSGAVADVMRRVVSPCFASAWSFARDLTGRRRRLRHAAEGRDRAAAKRRGLDSWKRSQGR